MENNVFENENMELVFNLVNNIYKSIKSEQTNFNDLLKVKRLFDEHPEILTYQNSDGKNLGMLACEFEHERIAMFALDNNEASIQQDNNGMNIGMYAASHKLERATLKALDNETASLQQDNDGNNIGMHSAIWRLEKATLKAKTNEEAIKQTNIYGKNIDKLASIWMTPTQKDKKTQVEKDIVEILNLLHKDNNQMDR